ncbi:MAG: superoxide dismutase [Bacteroidota bacterium]|jgi:Fe-Mn family superoxide dismutase|nr:superoxide dismutase [Bacteroidota bacterium]
MAFQLPDLPFPKDALAPFLSPETFDYHHGKHHAAYVNNANNLIKDTAYDDMPLEDVIRKAAADAATGLFNNSAQIWNHTFFWNCMSPNGGGAPTGKIGELITRDFGGIDALKEQFSKAAVTLFGSGWAWLVLNAEGKLELLQLSNADTPLVHNKTALLTLDVWEHAYYIDYRNARPKFVEGFWDVVNWQHANSLL